MYLPSPVLFVVNEMKYCELFFQAAFSLSFCLLELPVGTVAWYGSREGTIQKYFANPKKYFKSQYYSQITVEKFDKSKKLLQILRKFVDPQITFSI